MKKVFIVGAKRTAIDTFGGAFERCSGGRAWCLLHQRLAIEQSEVDPKYIEETIMGCILTANQGMGREGQVSIGAGVPIESPGYLVNMLCGSERKSTMSGPGYPYGRRRSGLDRWLWRICLIAPYMLDKARFGYRMGSGSITDHMIRDGANGCV
jgi:acetyl-CoA C-acetyltransferase